MTCTQSLDRSARPLRALWILWLASVIIIFAWPALVMKSPVLAGRIARSCISLPCGPTWLGVVTEWRWPWERVHTPFLVLMAVVPTVVHLRARRGLPSATVLARSTDEEPAGYRTAPPCRPVPDARAVRAHLCAYAWRLALAMGLAALVYTALLLTTFVGTASEETLDDYSVTEYVLHATLLLGAMAIHIPTRTRVFGPVG